MRTVLTTGQVAKICEVGSRTVAKWFDSGELKGFRIPMSTDRRINCDDLERFLKEREMECFLPKLEEMRRDGVSVEVR